MIVEDKIAEIFQDIGKTWTIRGRRNITPNSEDVQRTLDEAARQLYNEKPGTRLEVGGLIIEKRPIGHDVYVMVGSYE